MAGLLGKILAKKGESVVTTISSVKPQLLVTLYTTVLPGANCGANDTSEPLAVSGVAPGLHVKSVPPVTLTTMGMPLALQYTKSGPALGVAST